MRFFQRRTVGIVDTRGSRIQGWAFDRWTNKRVGIDIYVDGRKVGETVADRYRADLTSVSRDGHCAFQYMLQPELLDGASHTIEICPSGTRRPLTNGRYTTRLIPNDYFAGLARQMLRNGLWLLGGSIAEGSVALDGFLISPPGRPEGRITINGRALALTLSEGHRHWKSALPPDASVRAFAGTMPLDPAWTELHASFGLEQPFDALQDFHYPLFPLATPDQQSRARVAGATSAFAFNIDGYTTALKLDTLMRRFGGRPFSALGPVLDWGCGCGRIARFVARSGGQLHGADIDSANVAWCADHIRGSFAAISAEPPTAYPDNFFDAICGISVFTHLNRHYEQLWLAELFRIARPGALLLLSVHGNVAAARAGLLEHVLSSDFTEGFVDVGRSYDIDEITRGSDYYRNVFHQPAYIAEVWGRYFEILSIEESIIVIGNHQDLVVARKPMNAARPGA